MSRVLASLVLAIIALGGLCLIGTALNQKDGTFAIAGAILIFAAFYYAKD
jgi:hypothetical protein